MALTWFGCREMMFRMPGRSYRGPLPPLSPSETALEAALRGHVEELASKIGERHVHRPEALARSSRYIEETLRGDGYEVTRVEVAVSGSRADNLAAELDGRDEGAPILVVGAHYDSAWGTPGANDNASGVAALLELARLLAPESPARTIRFVAFPNEEPPHFATRSMGSYVYARHCRREGHRIFGMISLETIGYYRDEPGTQHYPFPLGALYPSTGDFIAFVSNLSSRRFLHRVIGSFRHHARFPSEGGALPSLLPGVGWSDHRSFWTFGYPAVMVTDTAPFRYPHYHLPTDTPDQIDFPRLSRVVEGLRQVILDLSRSPK